MTDLMRHLDSRNHFRGLRYLALAALLALVATAPAQAQITLLWTNPNVNWPNGSMSETFNGNDIPALCDPTTNCIAIRFTFSTMAAGSFQEINNQFTTPYEDGNPDSQCGPIGAWYFGTGCDLGVQFDPDAGQGMSPITITMEFLDPDNLMVPKPVTGLSFEISDIDWDPAGAQDFRRDQVVVTSDAGDPILMGCPASCTIAGNTATAIIGQQSASGSNAGTFVADFGPASVSTVTVTYNESSGNNNPGIRGIGLFFLTTMSKIPVELQSLTVD